MNISEKINPFSDIKIRDFLKSNADLVKSYDLKSVSDFLKEIINLESDIIGSELVKIPDIYKVVINNLGEDVSFFEYFVDNLDEKSHGLVGKFININLEKNTDFLDYHINKKIDIIHILLKNGIIPNKRMLKRWSAAHPTGKDLFEDEYSPVLFKKGIELLQEEEIFDFMIKNKNYFSAENIIGNEFYQKEIIYKIFDNDNDYFIKSIARFYEMEKLLNYLKEITKKTSSLTNEFNVFIYFLDDLEKSRRKTNNGGRMSYLSRLMKGIDFDDGRDILLRLKEIWLNLAGSVEKRERDLSYMVNCFNYFGEKNEEALFYIKEMRKEFESINEIINNKKDDINTIDKKRKRI